VSVPAHAPRKRFGQHFLVDRAIIERIMLAIDPQPQDCIVEIGPGLGALTRPLLDRLRHLHVVEIDRDIADRLIDAWPPERLSVHRQDVLHFDFARVAAACDGDLRVVGNLPYNISSVLLFHLAGYAEVIRDCHFMLQKEVVQRMIARPGGKDYGRLTVMLQWKFDIAGLFDVPPAAFKPMPRVDSTVVRMVPLAHPLACDPDQLADVVRRAFGQRRKTLRNSLADVVTADRLRELDIDPGLRAENLALAQFVRLANSL
jgi:16S rRNA (adenine1518-N6/adenine1519-N6)-dimethyltransferase